MNDFKITWERIDDQSETLRAAVFGGWLVRYQEGITIYSNVSGFRRVDTRSTMVFVPDPEHKWGREETPPVETVTVHGNLDYANYYSRVY